jgi:hypothetical protein
MDLGLLIPRILHKDQYQQKIETNKLIMKWPWIQMTFKWIFFKDQITNGNCNGLQCAQHHHDEV